VGPATRRSDQKVATKPIPESALRKEVIPDFACAGRPVITGAIFTLPPFGIASSMTPAISVAASHGQRDASNLSPTKSRRRGVYALVSGSSAVLNAGGAARPGDA